MSVSTIGLHSTGEAIHQVSLNSAKLRCHVISYGARLQALEILCRGQFRPVLLGYGSISPYLVDNVEMGSIVGRTAGRIRDSRYVIHGQEYKLRSNEGPHQLHGGPIGFGRRIWEITQVDDTKVTLSLQSEDGDQGHPGNLEAKVSYTVHESTLKISFWARTDQTTPISLTSHGYFNLAGAIEEGGIGKHSLQIHSNEFLPTETGNIVTGEQKSFLGHEILDFKESRVIGSAQIDHAYVLNHNLSLPSAILSAPDKSLELQVFTTLPVMQVYTADFLSRSINAFPSRSAICLEPQMYPDSVNCDLFPSSLIRPGQVYNQSIDYRFST